MGHIHLSCHCRCKRRVFIHKTDCDLFHLHFIPIIIRVRFKNHLLSLVPLLHDITPGTDGILPVIFIIGMLRYDSYNGHCIRPDREGGIHMEFYRGIIHRHRFLQHGKVIDTAVFHTKIICKSHIGSCQRLPVRKFYVISYGNRPGQAILTHGIICRQILADLQICRSGGKRALDQRFMHMLTGSPAVYGIKACLRLRGGGHGYDYTVRRLCCCFRSSCRHVFPFCHIGCLYLCRRLCASAAGKSGSRNDCGA